MDESTAKRIEGLLDDLDDGYVRVHELELELIDCRNELFEQAGEIAEQALEIKELRKQMLRGKVH